MNRTVLVTLFIAAGVGVIFAAYYCLNNPAPMPTPNEAIQWQKPPQPGMLPAPEPFSLIKFMFTNPITLPITLLALGAWLVRIGIELVGRGRRFS